MSAGSDGDLVTVGLLREYLEQKVLARINDIEQQFAGGASPRSTKVGSDPFSKHYYGPPVEFGAAVASGADPWVHRSKAMSCATCMWFVRKEKSGPQPPTAREVGRCRRHAPTMAGYPVVFEMDWCGDHKLDENKA